MNNFEINTIGLKCPEPLMLVRKKLREINTGDTITVLADDLSTIRDFKLLCSHMSHKLLSQSQEKDILTFIIEK
ncbi:MAG: sulfurtransferase TusA family protein [Succinivibrionaceae bacterium]